MKNYRKYFFQKNKGMSSIAFFEINYDNYERLGVFKPKILSSDWWKLDIIISIKNLKKL